MTVSTSKWLYFFPNVGLLIETNEGRKESLGKKKGARESLGESSECVFATMRERKERREEDVIISEKWLLHFKRTGTQGRHTQQAGS